MQAVFRIKGYDSFEQIAVGGMAVVYKARKQSIKKTVAIKVLLPHLAADTRFITRFQQEAEAAAKVQHDNIVNVIDYGRSDSSYYIVMEYYDGLTIEELLRTQPRLPIDVALTMVLNVCYGLEAAHGERLVHRDIKPANIILTRMGGIKIADFGLAKDVDKFTLVTHTGKVVGTPAYMSPEQTRGEPVGTQSDIFSAGVVAYELLTGRRPFDGTSYSEVVDRIQSFEPAAVSSINPMVETHVEAVVKRMMGKALSERYSNVSEPMLELEALMDRHALRRDRRTLAEFFSDPVGYTEAVNQQILERLMGEAPGVNPRERSHKAAAVSHYRKVLYLDPNDDGARKTLKQLGVREGIEDPAGGTPRTGTSTAPNTTGEFRVVLDSFDRSVESVDSFALKLAMRLKAPVPRMRSLVSRTPCTVVQRIPYKKARWLVQVLQELGGEARMEAVAAEKAPSSTTNAAAQPAPDDRSANATRNARERRTSSGGIVCPRCGWEEDADAKFCSLCLRRFNKTDKIEVRSVTPGFENPEENPLGLDAPESRGVLDLVPGLRNVPPHLLYGGGVAVVIVIAILVSLLR